MIELNAVQEPVYLGFHTSPIEETGLTRTSLNEVDIKTVFLVQTLSGFNT